MNKNASQSIPSGGIDFPMFRLSRSKATVDISPNTLRKFFKQGLPCYRRGKAVFVAKAELFAFIQQGRA
jgi:hypothetical protein